MPRRWSWSTTIRALARLPSAGSSTEPSRLRRGNRSRMVGRAYARPDCDQDGVGAAVGAVVGAIVGAGVAPGETLGPGVPLAAGLGETNGLGVGTDVKAPPLPKAIAYRKRKTKNATA